MSYQVDHSRQFGHSHRHIEGDKPSDAKWIIGGFVALALIIGGLFMFGETGGTGGTVGSKPGAGNPAMTMPADRPAPAPMR